MKELSRPPLTATMQSGSPLVFRCGAANSSRAETPLYFTGEKVRQTLQTPSSSNEIKGKVSGRIQWRHRLRRSIAGRLSCKRDSHPDCRRRLPPLPSPFLREMSEIL